MAANKRVNLPVRAVAAAPTPMWALARPAGYAQRYAD